MRQEISTWIKSGIDFNGNSDAYGFLMGEGYEEVKAIYLKEMN